MVENETSGSGRLQRIRELFDEAVAIPSGSQREQFLEEACGSDAELRAEVERYLSADADTGGPLDISVEEIAAPLFDEGSAGAAREDVGLPGSPDLGSSIGPYRLLEVIGEGGMGTVYRADQSAPVQREVALKLIKLGMDTREVVRRFEAERQALAVMEHPNIARVFDGGSTDLGRPYFVMEFVDGVDISEYCDRQRLSTVDRVRLFLDVCDAVQHAHQKGVIHRDLKPSNVLVSNIGGRHVCKVIDFGVARVIDHEAPEGTRFTRTGHALGTPEYMSPEQVTGEAHSIDTRTDIYALGVILYELLCGTLPREKRAYVGPALLGLVATDPPTPSKRFDSLAETQQTIAELRRTHPQALRRQLSGDLDWIVSKAMDRERSRRYGAASELAADLRRYLTGDMVLARPPSMVYRARKFARRNKGALVAGVALMVTLAAGATVSTIGFVRAARNAAIATDEAARAAAVSDFLDQMLRAADPVRGADTETTVREVLDAASAEVEGGSLGERPLVEIAVRRSIGGTYMQLGLLEEAEQHLLRAQTLLETTEGARDLERVLVLDELGQLRRQQGDAAAAEELYRQALALADTAGFATDGGDGEGIVNTVRNDLGLALRDAGRYGEAAEVLGALAASERRLLSRDDVGLATTLNNLALVRRAQGDADGAIELFQETLDILRAAFGESHVYIAIVLESIGSLEQRVGRYEAADSLMVQALTMRRQILGEQHPDIVNSLDGLGLLRRVMGDYDGAQSYLSEALDMSLEISGERHPRTASILNNLGLAYLGQRETDLAEEAFRRAIAIREELLGEEHPSTLNARSNLAAALVQSGAHSEAEALAREVVMLERSIGLADQVLLGSAVRTWGRALFGLKRFQEAEETLLSAYEILEPELGMESRDTQRTVLALTELYEAWGQEEASAEWRARLVDR